MRAEFIEDRKRADTDRACGRVRKERRVSFVFAWSLEFLLGMMVSCRVFSGIREQR